MLSAVCARRLSRARTPFKFLVPFEERGEAPDSDVGVDRERTTSWSGSVCGTARCSSVGTLQQYIIIQNYPQSAPPKRRRGGVVVCDGVHKLRLTPLSIPLVNTGSINLSSASLPSSLDECVCQGGLLDGFWFWETGLVCVFMSCV